MFPILTRNLFLRVLLCAVIGLSALTYPAIAKSVINPDDYIIIKHKTPQNIYEDGKHFASIGEYKQADETYNYVLSVAKETRLRRKILLAKKDIRKKVKTIEREESKNKAIEAKKTKKEVASLTKKAYQLYNKNDLDGAAKIFEKILKMDPYNKTPKLYLDKKIPAKQKRIDAKKTKKRK